MESGHELSALRGSASGVQEHMLLHTRHVSALIGHLQVGIRRQRKISITSIGMGDEISFAGVDIILPIDTNYIYLDRRTSTLSK